ALGGDDPMAAMHHTHRAMQQLGRLLRGMVQDLPREAPPDSSPDAPTGAPAAPLDPAAINDLRSLLYGLEAIARLHFAQEDELYHALVDPKPPAAAPPGR
ncbi:MAG: hypothetical protein KGQ40_15545, partial [Rhodospirillales bacterium]|nr:hypothetical protein [Rhodospirillales bacterium]